MVTWLIDSNSDSNKRSERENNAQLQEQELQGITASYWYWEMTLNLPDACMYPKRESADDITFTE